MILRVPGGHSAAVWLVAARDVARACLVIVESQGKPVTAVEARARQR